MTNEQAKQEAIKKAWDRVSNFELAKKDIDENGIYHFTNTNLVLNNLEYIEVSDGYRPSSLTGIEDNNGWIRIEPDGSNLSDENGSYRCLLSKPHFGADLVTIINLNSSNFNGILITHYKPIKEEPKPVY